MGRTAFFLRAYNDIDHIAPVIWKFVKAGDNPVVVFHTDIDYENDYRIKFLMSEGEVQIFRFLDKLGFRVENFKIRVVKRMI